MGEAKRRGAWAPAERFPVHLYAVKLDGAEWELIEQFHYYSVILRGWIRVPAGFRTDLTSVPSFARWYVSVDGQHTKAAIIHDYLYVHASIAEFPNLTRKDADRVFLEALEVRGIRFFQRWIMYLAVRVGGGRTFRND